MAFSTQGCNEQLLSVCHCNLFSVAYSVVGNSYFQKCSSGMLTYRLFSKTIRENICTTRAFILSRVIIFLMLVRMKRIRSQTVSTNESWKEKKKYFEDETMCPRRLYLLNDYRARDNRHKRYFESKKGD